MIFVFRAWRTRSERVYTPSYWRISPLMWRDMFQVLAARAQRARDLPGSTSGIAIPQGLTARD
jgi:hypothetical protein